MVCLSLAKFMVGLGMARCCKMFPSLLVVHVLLIVQLLGAGVVLEVVIVIAVGSH